MFDDSFNPFNSFDYAATYDYGSHYDYSPTIEHEDPMAYVVPAVPDAIAFDSSASNAAVGFALNEVSRASDMVQRSMLDEGRLIAESYSMPYTVREDGWPDVATANLLGHTVAEVSAYYRAKFDFEVARYGRVISLQ
jgi:hypothetical protein